MRRRSWFLRLAGGLMVLLGAARAVGGLVLWTQGIGAIEGIVASPGEVRSIATGLLIVGAAELILGAGVLRRSALAARIGAIVTVLFVVDGAINGWVLFGRPGDGGSIVNLIVAAAILFLLYAGRGKLDSPPRSAAPSSGDAQDKKPGIANDSTIS